MAADNLMGTVSHSASFEYSETSTAYRYDIGRAQFAKYVPNVWHVGFGTGSNQMDLMWQSRRSLTGTNATEDIDVAGGITDDFGDPLTMVTIKFLYIKADDDNPGDLVIGNATAPISTILSATGTLTLKAGASVMLMAPLTGWAVTATTADDLKILHTTGTGWYNIMIGGTSA